VGGGENAKYVAKVEYEYDERSEEYEYEAERSTWRFRWRPPNKLRKERFGSKVQSEVVDQGAPVSVEVEFEKSDGENEQNRLTRESRAPTLTKSAVRCGGRRESSCSQRVVSRRKTDLVDDG